MPAKIPVILVTGFLGSGKTTLLRRLAKNHPQWRMIFLVNEFADKSVDQLTLDTTGTPTQSVVGGSLFCECKAAEFVHVMKDDVLRRHNEQPLDAVVIETSGIADPEAIGELMANHALSEHFEIRRIICVLAAKRFLSLIRNLPSVEAQIRTSDFIIINKTDLCKPSLIDEVETEIRLFNTSADIIRAEHCQTDFNPLGAILELPRQPLATCDANPFTTIEVVWPKDRCIEEAKAWLESLPDTILRIKGCIQTVNRFWHIERTIDTLEIKPLAACTHNELVLISHDHHEMDLQAAVESLKAKVN